jgi:hypothetical protein
MPAFGLMLRPEIAALTMSGSSLLVALNALALKRLRLPAQPAARHGTVPAPVRRAGAPSRRPAATSPDVPVAPDALGSAAPAADAHQHG